MSSLSTVELKLSFIDDTSVVITLDGHSTGYLPFSSPLTKADYDDLRWYIEVYGTISIAPPTISKRRGSPRDLAKYVGRSLTHSSPPSRHASHSRVFSAPLRGYVS